MTSETRPALYYEVVRKYLYQEHILTKFIQCLRSTNVEVQNLNIFEQKLDRARILLKIIHFTGRPQEKYTLHNNIENLRLSGKLIKDLLIESKEIQYEYLDSQHIFKLDLRFKIYATEIYMSEFSRDD